MSSAFREQLGCCALLPVLQHCTSVSLLCVHVRVMAVQIDNSSLAALSLAGRGVSSLLPGPLQAWRVTHPPARGHKFCGTRPLVHVGFMKSWLAGSFDQKVISRVMELVERRKAGTGSMTVYVTGALLNTAFCFDRVRR